MNSRSIFYCWKPPLWIGQNDDLLSSCIILLAGGVLLYGVWWLVTTSCWTSPIYLDWGLKETAECSLVASGQEIIWNRGEGIQSHSGEGILPHRYSTAYLLASCCHGCTWCSCSKQIFALIKDRKESKLQVMIEMILSRFFWCSISSTQKHTAKTLYKRIFNALISSIT